MVICPFDDCINNQFGYCYKEWIAMGFGNAEHPAPTCTEYEIKE